MITLRKMCLSQQGHQSVTWIFITRNSIVNIKKAIVGQDMLVGFFLHE